MEDLSCQEAFEQILKLLDEEDYERAAESARQFLTRLLHEEEKPYHPYATYLKLFADAYRNFQISYNYTPIRNGFKLAYYLLDSDVKKLKSDAHFVHDHHVLVPDLEHLSEMLCQYTWCENSFINNDPAALERHSCLALEEEKNGLSLLSGYNPSDSIFRSIGEWLKKYFEKNQLLHGGLNSCAKIYGEIFQGRRCPHDFFNFHLGQAEAKLKALKESSSELSSELNAHIRHIRLHHQRLEECRHTPTLLRITKGRLVLMLSAACDDKCAEGIIDNPDPFKEGIKTKFQQAGIEVENFLPLQLHDIFQTTFGKPLLKSLAFDLPSTRVKFLGENNQPRCYEFETRITLSALGVCTISFALDIEKNGHGLSVEEARALQSCICPHAGQVILEFDPAEEVEAGQPLPARPVSLSPFKFMDRLNLNGLVQDLEQLHHCVGSNSSPKMEELRKQVNEAMKSVHTYIEDLWKLKDWSESEKDRPESEADSKPDNKFCNCLNPIINQIQELLAHPHPSDPTFSELESIFSNLLEHCRSFTYLSDLAQSYLKRVKEVLFPVVGQDSVPAELWFSKPDTGWYCYLFATSIEELSSQRGVIRAQIPFDEIENHPDIFGLAIEQREARASFDDWRNMKIDLLPKQNLALIRSHRTDAFFCSEYQAFLYFPDDPKFLTDQYEATVELMIRMATVLKAYSFRAEESSRDARKKLEAAANAKEKIKVADKAAADKIQPEDLSSKLTAMRVLRSKATEMKNLLMKTAISRYKDHGDLMLAVMRNMKLDQLAQLLDDQLKFLTDLDAQILEKLEKNEAEQRDSQQRRLSNVIALLTLLISGNSAVNALFGILYPQKPPAPGAMKENWVTLILVGAIFISALLIFLWPNALDFGRQIMKWFSRPILHKRAKGPPLSNQSAG